MTSKSKLHTVIGQYINLIKLLKYTLIEAAILIAIPLSAFSWSPLYSFLGGLIQGLRIHHIFWMSICLFAASWALMFNMGLVFDGNTETQSGVKDPTEKYPAWARRHLGVPVRWRQFIAFSLLALPGLLVFIAKMESGKLWGIFYAILGALITYLFMIVASSPARLASEDYRAIPGPTPRLFWKLIRANKLRGLGFRLLRIASWLPRKLRLFKHILESRKDPNGVEKTVLKLDHYFALTNALIIILIFCIIGYLYYPFTQSPSFPPPALAYFYVFLILLIWAFGFLEYHLTRYHISPILAGLVYLAFVYGAFQSDLVRGSALDVDHFFHVFPEESEASPLSPVDVVKNGKNGNNLVVVTATGGGIQAAGWFTFSMQQLHEVHGIKYEDVRLVSTVSGGSVGASFYLNNRIQNQPKNGLSVYNGSVSSSLLPVTYAMAYRDFWKMAVGPLAFWAHEEDRGLMLERYWSRRADGEANSLKPSLGNLTSSIADGRIPAPIFNATTMETGRRIMISPIDFNPRFNASALDGTDSISAESARAQTLNELLTTPSQVYDRSGSEEDTLPEGALKVMRENMDIGLWTAARLSASFSYVSPAATPKIKMELPSRSYEGWQQGELRGFHLIDGGYYDNYGIASALDFLEPVLYERLQDQSGLNFNRVLIIQLRSSYVHSPSNTDPASGFLAAVAGPELGVLNIRDGVAFSRNELETRRFMDVWNRLFEAREVPVKIATVVFEPPPSKLPLSWHLTREQKNNLKRPWIDPTPEFQANIEKLKEFLTMD